MVRCCDTLNTSVYMCVCVRVGSTRKVAVPRTLENVQNAVVSILGSLLLCVAQ
jgi:hypothetical protein